MRFHNQPDPGPDGRGVVVVGGGVGGMASALALARAGLRVTLLEQDDIPPADHPEAAFTTPRRGLPQARQTHGFLARLTRVMAARFPDVLDDLHAHGAHQARTVPPDLPPEPGDEDLAVLLVRRTTFEWVLRRAVHRQPGVHWRGPCPVDGLVTDGPGEVTDRSGPPRVRGVRLRDGTEQPADAVVVATGRRTDVPRWFGDLGVTLPETVHHADLLYLTRWYRLPPGGIPPTARDFTGDLGYLKFLAVPCDGATLSVTIAVPSGDTALRRLLSDPDRFDRAAATLASLREVFADGPPPALGGIEPMGGFVNRLRRFLDGDGRPTVLGVHAVGDAHTCTNPYYGRGCSLALVQAVLLADAFTAHADPAERAVAYEQASAREIEPWFHQAVQMDTVFDPGVRRRHHDTADGGNGNDTPNPVHLVLAASATDPVIGRALQRVFNLLLTPDELARDEAFTRRVGEILADPASVPPVPRLGPRRRELLDLLSAPAGQPDPTTTAHRDDPAGGAGPLAAQGDDHA